MGGGRGGQEEEKEVEEKDGNEAEGAMAGEG